MTLRMTMITLPAIGLLVLAAFLLGLPAKFSGNAAHLDCESSMGTSSSNVFAPILAIMKADAEQEINSHEVKDIALYYRDMKSGVWLAVNKDEKFNLASLMKVPLMIECLKSAEFNPSLINKRLGFNSAKDWNSQQNLKPAKTMEPGKLYTLDEVMLRMVAYSDNNAMSVVLNEFPSEGLFQFLSEHNIDYVEAPDGIKMSLSNYAWFFAALYNKSLLGEAMSKKALSYLGAEDFPQGMHSALPPTVGIEGKFGEKVLFDEKGKVSDTELHEVGIILDGDHPFMLGIMTSGRDLPTLEKIIQKITHDVYEATERIAHLDPNQMNCMHTMCHSLR